MTRSMLVIEIRGGLVQAVYADEPVPRVFVVDHDQDQDSGIWAGEFGLDSLRDMDEETRQAVERELRRDD